MNYSKEEKNEREKEDRKMNKTDSYNNLHFERQPRRMSSKLIVTGGIILAFTFLWLVIPQDFLYWVLLIPLICLAWSANYGFQNALADLIKVLQKLEHS